MKHSSRLYGRTLSYATVIMLLVIMSAGIFAPFTTTGGRPRNSRVQTG